MLFTGTRSSVHSSHTPETPSAHGIGRLRAGIAIALVALTLMVGFGRPAETAAYKSESLVCTTIQAGFDYAFSKALKAKVEGDTAGFNTWNTIAHGANDLWFSAGCGGEGASGTFEIR
jgi:hypothetical protein